MTRFTKKTFSLIFIFIKLQSTNFYYKKIINYNQKRVNNNNNIEKQYHYTLIKIIIIK